MRIAETKYRIYLSVAALVFEIQAFVYLINIITQFSVQVSGRVGALLMSSSLHNETAY